MPTMFTAGNQIGRRYSLRGAEEVRRNLSLQIAEKPKAVARSAKKEFTIEMKESMRITPVKTGALRDSHRVTEPEIVPGRMIRVQITVGGGDINYAIEQHENLTFYHKHGEAKFLEKTLNASSKFMAARIAAGVNRG